jgi:predicted AlkP superfamily pyrophosphatase or phosphodiesterase
MDKQALSIFVFIDALGWELLQRHSFLDTYAPYRRPLDTVFGYSSACDPTILTGRPPRDHGHFSFFRYDPESSPFGFLRPLALIPAALIDRARVRNKLSKLVQRVLGYTGYFQLYSVPMRFLPMLDYTEKNDIYENGGINGGQPTVFDHLRREGLPFHVSDWRQSERENLEAASKAVGEGRVRAIYLYLAELDGIMHAHGTRSAKVGEKLHWYERQLGRLAEEGATRYGNVRLHVFSDHGMTDVVTVSDLARRVEGLGLRYGKDYAAVFDSTMARFWFHTADAREAVEKLLATETAGHVLSEGELARLGCDFPEQEYGELFFLLDPGVIFCPSFMGRRPVKGMHGYDPGHPDSRASYLSSHRIGDRPRQLADLHDLMLAETGLLREDRVA